MANAREWWGMVAYVVGPIVGIAVWVTFTTWVADTTCPTCPVEWRFLVFGALTFVALPLVAVAAFVWVGRKQWQARMRREQMRRQEFED